MKDGDTLYAPIETGALNRVFLENEQDEYFLYIEEDGNQWGTAVSQEFANAWIKEFKEANQC